MQELYIMQNFTYALCHRQYEKYNLTIGIAIYDDCIEIENPGVLPPQLTTESIKQSHNSYPYNQIMADVLFKTTFLENWGSGVRRIIDACIAQNLPEPEWTANGAFVTVKFMRPAKDATVQVEPINDPSTVQVSSKYRPSTTQVRPKYDPSTTQVSILIKAMRNDYMTITEIMEACSLSSRKRFRENYITPALKDGAIERKYPEQPNHPQQQYQLTEKAKEWKQTNKV